jgi:mannobiose 2-epimerase
MEYYIERLEQELKKIMDFWINNLIAKENASIYPECAINGFPDKSKDLGSLYLSRIMFGASAACRFLNTNEYKVLADLAFKILYERFRNPAGGFYWARTSKNEILHDSDNSNMAQAFILYGLAEYAQFTRNPVVESEMKKLQQFITKSTHDGVHRGYLDGFSVDWKQEKNFTKSLGTHLHLMEALVKQYQYNGDNQLVPLIRELIELITDRFIDTDKAECYHRLTPDLNKLPNFNWAGHNAEVGWLLTWASKAINDNLMFQYSCQISKKLTEKVIEQAFDKNYGGVFNEIKDGVPIEENKYWWPQAETALACMNAYICSKDKLFLSYGLRLVEYIENTFSDSGNGEWFTLVTRDGRPVESEPKVHFWKSMYHNVRYCIEMSKLIKSLIR